MSKRDFFILALKLIGMYFALYTVFTFIPNSFLYMTASSDMFIVVYIIATSLLMMVLWLMLVYYAGNIVDIFKIDRGFEEDRIEFSGMDAFDIMRIGIFVVGGLLLTFRIPEFIGQTILTFKKNSLGDTLHFTENFYLISYGIQVLLGFYLITNYDMVAKLLFSREENEKTDD